MPTRKKKHADGIPRIPEPRYKDPATWKNHHGVVENHGCCQVKPWRGIVVAGIVVADIVVP